MGQTEYVGNVETYGPGSFGAYVPELPGIGVAGETEDEVRELVAAACTRSPAASTATGH